MSNELTGQRDRVINGVLGTKLGMTQVWDEDGNIVPVTVVQAGPCVVTQVRSQDVDGYDAVQIAYGAIDPRKVTKPLKGKGNAGVMKRHGFAGVSASHGQHRNHRKPGSIGGASTPARVFKGMRMAGRMGGNRNSVQNLTVQAVDAEKNLVLIKGAVPGPKGGIVLVRSAVKGPKKGA